MNKRILALFLVLVMLFLLCGCDALDQLRLQRAEYDGENIVHQGVRYKKLPTCSALIPETDFDRPVYVVDPEVPLLLIETENLARFYQSKDSSFLLDQDSESVYCREELYEQLKKTIQQGWEYTKVYYEYMVYTDDGWDYEMHKYMLTQEQIEALEFLVTNVEPQTLGEGMYLQSDWGVYLTECSEDELFLRSSSRIAAVGSGYYLVLDEGQAFQVPDGMISIFDEITQAYRTAYDYPETDQYA